MAPEPVIYERRGDVAVVLLNRPEVRNAVDEAMLAGLEDAVRRIGDEDPRVVVLSAAGARSFCAGADLTWVAGLADPSAGLELSRRMRELLARLHQGPRPLIAAVGGDAFGGGCEMMTACHLRIAADHVRFSFRQAAMGVSTGWGGGARLFDLLGRGPALRLLLTAETFDAAEAQRIGWVDRVVPGSELMAAALATAEQVAANSADSVAAFLELARAAGRKPAGEVAELETRLFEALWDGEHFQSKVAQWRARR